jgi:hypothetical protein
MRRFMAVILASLVFKLSHFRQKAALSETPLIANPTRGYAAVLAHAQEQRHSRDEFIRLPIKWVLSLKGTNIRA